jgi:hypothetical protein
MARVKGNARLPSAKDREWLERLPAKRQVKAKDREWLERLPAKRQVKAKDSVQ